MTQDQLKELKEDDEILILAEVDSIRNDGNVEFRLPYRNCNGAICWGGGVVIAERVSLMAERPKYDPCRKFRKGDIVRLREYNGRKPYDFWHKQTIKHFGSKLDTVYEDEKEDSGHVDIFQDAPIDELMVRVHSSYLELVTPVEELEPYSVHESEVVQGFDIVRDKLCVMNFPYGAKECGWYYNRIDAKEAAEAERDRLNEEYRKEQSNG